MSNIIGFKPRDKVKMAQDEQIKMVRSMYEFLTMLSHEQYFKEINRQYIPNPDNPFHAWFENFTMLTMGQVCDIYDPEFILSFKDNPEVRFDAWLEDIANLSSSFLGWIKQSNIGDTFALTNILSGTRDVFQTLFIKTTDGIYLRDIYLDCRGTIATAAMQQYCIAFSCSVADVYTDAVDESL